MKIAGIMGVAVLCVVICVSLSAEDMAVRVLVRASTSSLPFLHLEALDAEEDFLPSVEISVEIFSNHAQALARLLNGDVALLFTGTSVGWNNHLNGGPLVVLNTGIWGVSSLIGMDDAFETLSDLNGKTIALPFPGAPLDIQMRYILDKAGIDPDSDVRIVYAPFPQTAAQLIAGQVDAAPLPEPLATTLVMGKGMLRYIKMTQAWADATGTDGSSPQVSLFAVSGASEKLLQAIPEIVNGWRDASQWIAGNPDQAAERYAEVLGQPKPIVAEALRHTVFRVPGFWENRNRIRQYMNTLQADTGEVAPADSFFFTP